MKVYCRGVARIKDKNTGSIHEVQSEDLDWEDVETHERGMGPETHYMAEFEHAVLGKLEWSLWEYPMGAENNRETNVGEHEVIQDFDYGLEHERD